MSWLDLFRKEEIKIILTLDELISKLKSEEDKLELRNKKVKEEIKQNLNLLIFDLKSQIQNLKSINLEQRREQERIKKIVLENLYFYIFYLERLIKTLEILNENLKTEEYIKEIQNIFNKFKKDSHNSFERATILIGKELEIVQKIIKSSFQNFNQIINENREIFEKLSLITNIQNQIHEFHNLKEIKEEIKNSIKELEKTIKNFKTEKDLLEKQYKDFIESSEYKEFIAHKEKTKKTVNELNQEILKIKEKINFKFLLKHHHEDARKSRFLQEYKDNFLDALEEDKNLEIIRIVKESLSQEITEEINKIKEKSLSLKQQPKADAQEKINYLIDKIRNMSLAILNTSSQIEEENKKTLRFNSKQNKQLDEINQQAKSILGEIEIKE